MPRYVPVTTDQKLWGARQHARVLAPHHPLEGGFDVPVPMLERRLRLTDKDGDVC